ncbi:recombinase family protein [Oscillospiraceae bacterium 38-13]
MARIRKSEASKTASRQIIWKIGKYIRLSRDDGNVVSESVVNQDKILNDEIPGFFEDGLYEVVDTYIDDGTSGTTDLERQDFQRMVQDMKCGRINCIIVKNLSRAFRNSANQGHFLEEFIPLYNTRFISLYQPRIDTFLDPEIVHSLEVSITGFMNEQYAYKTSADVRRTFKHKRENGEFIGAFAPYGYAKDPDDKNALIVDEEAAQVVRNIFNWFILEGMSKAGIPWPSQSGCKSPH